MQYIYIFIQCDGVGRWNKRNRRTVEMKKERTGEQGISDMLIAKVQVPEIWIISVLWHSHHHRPTTATPRVASSDPGWRVCGTTTGYGLKERSDRQPSIVTRERCFGAGHGGSTTTRCAWWISRQVLLQFSTKDTRLFKYLSKVLLISAREVRTLRNSNRIDLETRPQFQYPYTLPLAVFKALL